MANARGIRAGAAYIELFVSDSKLVRGLDKASKKLKAFGDAITGWGQKMAAIGAAITAPLVGSAKVFSEMGDQIAKASARTGISVETLSELAYAAELSGANLQVLEGSLRKMQKAIVAAAEGSESAIDALAKLGLTVDDFRGEGGRSPDQQFKLIADRLSQIKSPALRAALAMELFGKSGAQLLPLMADGAKGIEALQQQARDLGLTMSTEDAKAAEALNDTFDSLWKVLKQGVFVIGSALAPTLKSLAEWIINTLVTTTAWIKRNKQLVVTILKVAAGMVVGGSALIALGYAITTVGTVMGSLAAILSGVGTVLGVLGAIIAGLVSPIGLVIAAVTTLGAYLIHVSGTGGQALAWLSDRFTELWDFARQAFQGIADALIAGDIALAAKVLWLSLKVVWQTGVLELTRLWESLKSDAMKIVYGLWYGVQAAWEIGVTSVADVMLRFYYGILNLWQRLGSGVMNIWDGVITWVAKRMVDLWALADRSMDPGKVKEQLEQDLQGRIGQRDQEQNRNLQQIVQERDQALKQLQQEHEQNLARIGQSSLDAENQLDAEAQKKIDAAQAELEAARKEWQEAVEEARQKREAASTEPNRLSPSASVADYLEGLGPAIEKAKQTIQVVGTFNAMEARGLGAGQMTDRIAKATEETAKNTKKLLNKQAADEATFD